MDMNAASILRSKTVAIVSTCVLGAGVLGGVAFAAVPTPSDTAILTAPATNPTDALDDDKAKAKLKAVLDALVAKNVITQSQEDAIIDALTAAHDKDHPKLRELAGAAPKESVDYIGRPAQAEKAQLAPGKSLRPTAATRLPRSARATEPHHEREERGLAFHLRDLILGGQDGLVNVLGLVLGLTAAGSDAKTIAIGGLAALLAESGAMAGVIYTSAAAE